MPGLGDPARPHAWEFEAIGAPWRITTATPVEPEVREAIARRIDEFDRDWSRFRDDSLVARIATSPGVFEMPQDAAPLFDLYRRLGDATAGAVSPLVGRRLEHLGYDRDYSFRPAPGAAADPAAVPRFDDVAAWDADALTLTTTDPVLIDVGAAGKGFLVDLVTAHLDQAGHDDYVVDASGDLRHRGDPATPARVALEHPADPSLAIGVIELANRALCASAVNRRTWGEGLHHVLDARTGLPTADVIATWAVAPTARAADGIATALFFADPAALDRAFPELALEAVRVFADGGAQYTTNFSGDLFA
ncbi:FAD:protein FMN transferase [Frondihabitans australicus]|uniref:FAD:protein FMN transferase n=1 Tax=Frondihabitans australicus TaxID=386892 RepID=A0A495IKN7_9MICO|nr:FAD:protein FMN transferase [Frondihabitans australicus]RKR76562.1 thiamine biosynthesis lipoprotein [Frondihabitans australicus]